MTRNALPFGFLLFLLNILPLFGSAQEADTSSMRGRLWSISGNGLKDSSYLYGTIHIMDEKAYRFPDGTKEAFRSADAYAMELNMDSVNQLTLMSELMMEDSTSLRDLLTEEEYADLKAFAKDSMGIKLARFDRFHPMLTLSRIQMQSFEKDCTLALDMYFHQKAKRNGKPVIGLERMEEQVAAFQSIPYDSIAQQLVQVARGEIESSGGKASMETMLEHYVEGDLEALLRTTRQQKSSENFTEVFLTERNKRMADRAARHMKEQSLFIAIGAAHLPGEKGVIQLLRDKGYHVRSLSGERE
jgi:uncharacterized protein YbaP (TraB family)